MKALISITVFAVLFNFIKADLCAENFTLGELPGGVLKEVLTIVTTGVVNDFNGCPDEVEINDDEVRFFYYPPDNPDEPIQLDKNNPSLLNLSQPLKMLFPGWLCNVTNDNMPLLEKGYLERGGSNVVAVDWTKYSIDLYVNSFCYIPEISKLVAKFLCNINVNSGYDLSNVHLVGHSMGGQMSGMVGKEVQNQCQKVLGRITGLDPAGPLYQGIDEDRRLDKSDAQFVDVIHSNQAYLGYFGDCGHKDFYVNCGTFQPGCTKIDKDTPIESIINLPTSTVSCNHLRSVECFAESIRSDKFVATSCRTCPGLPHLGVCTKDIIFATKTIMGEDTPTNSSYYKYYVPTNSQSPYAKG